MSKYTRKDNDDFFILNILRAFFIQRKKNKVFEKEEGEEK